MLPGNKTSKNRHWHLVSTTIDKNHCNLFLNAGIIQSTLKYPCSPVYSRGTLKATVV